MALDNNSWPLPNPSRTPASPETERRDGRDDIETETTNQSRNGQHRRNPSHPALTLDIGRARSDSEPMLIPPPPARHNKTSVPPPPPSKLRQDRQPPSTNTQTTPLHRSIFPRYDPATTSTSTSVTTRSAPRSPPMFSDHPNRYSASAYSMDARQTHTHNNSLSEAFAATSDPVHAPLPSYRESMLDMPAAIQSTASDALDLWLLACGQDSQDLSICYNLGLDCVDLTPGCELLCFSSIGGALYTLRAQSDELNLIRTHPINRESSVSIAGPRLYAPSEEKPLLTTIFPLMSKIRAVDEANNATLSQGLSRSDALAIEREAITRAHATTAAPLLWNATSGSYYLPLPTGNDENDTPRRHNLSIEITANVSIRILESLSSSASSNLPSPVLTFSIPTKTLIVHTASVTSIPSLYAVDILISSMLVLLLHLHRTTALLNDEPAGPPTETLAQRSVPTQVPVFAPPPLAANNARGRSRSAVRAASQTRGRSGSRSRGPSRLGALLHPARAQSSLSSYDTPQASPNRNPSRLSTYSLQSATATTLRESPPLASSNTFDSHAANEHNGIRLAFSAPPTTPGSLEKGFDGGNVVVRELGGRRDENGDNATQQLSAQGTAPELDARNTGLDLSRFQAYDLKDPRLGAPTRLMLRILYWSFGVLVWVLGVSVSIAAEAIVLIGTCGAGGEGRDRER